MDAKLLERVLQRRAELADSVFDFPATTLEGLLVQQLNIGRVQGLDDVLRIAEDLDKEIDDE